jgi:heme-degrading monooxygenase HmoA
MSIVVVTRLRLREGTLFDEFFAAAVAVDEQAKASPGNQGTDVLADVDSVFWTLTAWQDRPSMRTYVETEPHLSSMDHLDEWCDEATFVDWEQDSPDLPDWQTAHAQIVADGQVAELSHATEANATRAFPPPAKG